MEKKIGTIVAGIACICPLTLQAQEVKSVSLDTIPESALPIEMMSPNISVTQPVLENGTDDWVHETSRPTLGGFPVLSGSSYYSETKDEIPLKIAPNAIPHYTSPSMNIGPISAYCVIYPIYKK